MKKSHGMTLLEMIFGIVLMGFATIVFTTLLVPQIKSSVTSHMETRGADLSQSFMSQIFSRKFDENSQSDGEELRCNEGVIPCTSSSRLGNDENSVSQFDDVDDYIGCWYSDLTKSQCENFSHKYRLSDALGRDVSSDYENFRVEVRVTYVDDNGAVSASPTSYKKISMSLYAGGYGPLVMSAIRGNY